MCWNSGVGTRTKSIRPVMWLKRVGLSQVSKDCRLTFFSSAPNIRAQGLGTAGGGGTKKKHFLLSTPTARYLLQSAKEQNSHRYQLCVLLLLLCLGTPGGYKPPSRKYPHRKIR